MSVCPSPRIFKKKKQLGDEGVKNNGTLELVLEL